MGIQQAKHFTRAIVALTGSLIVAAAGFACLNFSFAESFKRLSYDLPFLWRAPLDTHEITLIYLDDESAKELGQTLGDSWNRPLHTRLLDRLTQEKARLVLYDIIFDAPAADPKVDADFENAIRRNGKVILGGGLEILERVSGVREERVLPPTKPLRKAAAGWGLLVFRPVDADYGVRQLCTGTEDVPSATWKAAEVLGASVTHGARDTLRWLNYYGPRDSFASVNIAQALDPHGVAPGFFKDKIVLIGGRSAVSSLGLGRDEFATPYSLFGHAFSPGSEVHATVLLNLLRGEWLTRMSERWEIAIILIIGLAAGGLLGLLRPLFSTMIAMAASFGIICFACWFAWSHRIWFDWMIPAVVQIPLGLVWSVGSQYVLESRRRKELRKAFGFYLSPEMADRIANSDFDLRPGGKVVEATVLFTDLENFTTLSENLDPAEVSQILIDYFETTTRCVLGNKGTIIKYVGDAVMAAWGAPIDEPAHAIRAAEAACDLRSMTDLEVRGKKLHTRIGVHSGKVLAGNLGSSFRFDYTMIGDATNFASRLESLNKYLGTQALISEAVRSQLEDRFITRQLGEFRVAGKTRSVIIHELICRRDGESGEHNWIGVFEKGLSSFRAGDFTRARDFLNQTREMRGGFDGPAVFYLKKIGALETDGHSENWTGVVELSEK